MTNLKVLIVEDNPMHQKVLKFILKKYFTQNISIASNPKEAFPLLRQLKPDIVFLDIEMPYMKGDEMLEIMRNMEEFENMKVIVYSSVVDKKTVKAVIENKVVDFINKGSDQKIIINKLKKHFGLVNKDEIKKSTID
jgi:DNA-binding NarL/FixJ family response regulator